LFGLGTAFSGLKISEPNKVRNTQMEIAATAEKGSRARNTNFTDSSKKLVKIRVTRAAKN